jgi:hypothetical protein
VFRRQVVPAITTNRRTRRQGVQVRVGWHVRITVRTTRRGSVRARAHLAGRSLAPHEQGEIRIRPVCPVNRYGAKLPSGWGGDKCERGSCATNSGVPLRPSADRGIIAATSATRPASRKVYLTGTCCAAGSAASGERVTTHSVERVVAARPRPPASREDGAQVACQRCCVVVWPHHSATRRACKGSERAGAARPDVRDHRASGHGSPLDTCARITARCTRCTASCVCTHQLEACRVLDHHVRFAYGSYRSNVAAGAHASSRRAPAPRGGWQRDARCQQFDQCS